MPDTLAILMWVPQLPELLIIVVAILILFGGTKLPQLMRGMGTGIKEFKQAVRDVDDDKDKTSADSQNKPAE